MQMLGAPHFLLAYCSCTHLLRSAYHSCYASSSNEELRGICPCFDALLTSPYLDFTARRVQIKNLDHLLNTDQNLMFSLLLHPKYYFPLPNICLYRTITSYALFISILR